MRILICSLIVQFSKHSPMPTARKTLGYQIVPALTELQSSRGKGTNMAVLHGRVEGVLGDTHQQRSHAQILFPQHTSQQTVLQNKISDSTALHLHGVSKFYTHYIYSLWEPCEVSVINPIQEYDNGDNVAVSICQALTAFQVLIWWFVGMVSFVPHPPYKAVNR